MEYLKHQRISFCEWNINGLYNKIIGDKTKSVDFQNVINAHDFITLTEIWTSDIPSFQNYNHFTAAPKKTSK